MRQTHFLFCRAIAGEDTFRSFLFFLLILGADYRYDVAVERYVFLAATRTSSVVTESMFLAYLLKLS